MFKCISCGVGIDSSNQSAHPMDSFSVYLCSKDTTHFVIVPYYGFIYSHFLSKFIQADSNQPISERLHRELRKPNVATELIPKLLERCRCGGRFATDWGQFCRKCVTQKVFDDIGTSIQNGALTRDDIWVDNVVREIKSLASTWDIDLEAN